MKKKPTNMAASVRQRLLTLATQRGEVFDFVLKRYVNERLLYRLALSPHGRGFVLKGAMLFELWLRLPHRATHDMDLLQEVSADVEAIAAAFTEVAGLRPPEDDGIEFLVDSLRADPIRADQVYHGVRVRMQAKLGSALVSVQVDVGFGDAVTPGPVEVEYPTLLDQPSPKILAYPRETVVAEKFQAMVALDLANTRMKDFYDVWLLAKMLDFEGGTLRSAIAATFRRRKTELPREMPLAFTPAFSEHPIKQQQWRAFLNKGRLSGAPRVLTDIVLLISALVMPPTLASAARSRFAKTWPAGGPWQ